MKHGIIFLLILLFSWHAQASEIRIIRDAETEHALRNLALPLIKAATKRSPHFNQDLKFYLIEDDSVNAFVFDSNAIFIHTGLIKHLKKPELIAAVIAHEMGHIISEHPLTAYIAARQTMQHTIIGSLLGISLAALNPEAGLSVVAGAVQYGQRTILATSRINEKSADQIGIELLQSANYPISGMVETTSYFAMMTRSISKELNPYLMTHPIDSARLAHAKNLSEKLSQKNPSINQSVKKDFDRAFTKLVAYFSNPKEIIQNYQSLFKDPLNQKYALALAYSNTYKFPEALNILDEMIKSEPKNPFLLELKAEIFFKSRQIVKSISTYAEALKILPNSPNINQGYAIALLHFSEISGENHSKEAIKSLKKVLAAEPENILALDQLAKAHAFNMEPGMFYLINAEKHILNKEPDKAREMIEKARKIFKDSPPPLLNELNSLLEKQ